MLYTNLQIKQNKESDYSIIEKEKVKEKALALFLFIISYAIFGDIK